MPDACTERHLSLETPERQDPDMSVCEIGEAEAPSPSKGAPQSSLRARVSPSRPPGLMMRYRARRMDQDKMVQDCDTGSDTDSEFQGSESHLSHGGSLRDGDYTALLSRRR
ncbi:hypothetical protein BKA56DRAFT_625310 [Ilyonectria sp. MPI-CAGE-AT-0026]|nr:hypothetical protein BKA56DRAFT_625310 [Ilyonectria sp. MPI-CAGE-AT-0026]